MTYKVLTDHWKYSLQQGDIIPGDMYSEVILKRAVENRYIEPQKPTMDDSKKEIERYLDVKNIEYSEYLNKSELLDLIE